MNLTARNFFGGFLGGVLGILTFHFIMPALMPVGCLIGVVVGFWWDKLSLQLLCGWRDKTLDSFIKSQHPMTIAELCYMLGLGLANVAVLALCFSIFRGSPAMLLLLVALFPVDALWLQRIIYESELEDDNGKRVDLKKYYALYESYARLGGPLLVLRETFIAAACLVLTAALLPVGVLAAFLIASVLFVLYSLVMVLLILSISLRTAVADSLWPCLLFTITTTALVAYGTQGVTNSVVIWLSALCSGITSGVLAILGQHVLRYLMGKYSGLERLMKMDTLAYFVVMGVLGRNLKYWVESLIISPRYQRGLRWRVAQLRFVQLFN